MTNTPTRQSLGPKLSPELRTALNIARGGATLFAVVNHIANVRGWVPPGLGVVLRAGQEIVVVFILLSGFVIFANEYARMTNDLPGYVRRRVLRIYPLLIISMMISTLVALDNGTLYENFSWKELLGTLANIQDISWLKPGVIVDSYLGNDPLWTLSYEATFYVLFPFALKFWRINPKATNAFIGAGCCALYITYALVPNHWSLLASYFLVWWFGAMIANAYLNGERSILALRDVLGWLVLLAAIAGVVVWIKGFQGPGYYPFLMFRHFAVAAIMGTILFGPIGRRLVHGLSFAPALAAPIEMLTSISYGIYVLHVPVLAQWRRIETVPQFILACALLVLLAYVFDRRLSKFFAQRRAGRPVQPAIGSPRQTSA